MSAGARDSSRPALFPAAATTCTRAPAPNTPAITSPSTSGPAAISSPPPPAIYDASISRPRRSRPLVDNTSTAAYPARRASGQPPSWAAATPARLERAAARSAGRERLLHVERVAIEIARGRHGEHRRPRGAVEQRVAGVVGLEALAVLDRRNRLRAGHSGEHGLGRSLRSDRHGCFAGRSAVDRQANCGLTRLRAGIANRGDHAIAFRPNADHRQVARQGPHVANLDARRLGHRRVVAGIPPAFLQIGDDDDRAGLPRERLPRHVQAGQVASAAKSRHGGVDRRERERPVGGGRLDQIGAIRKRHDRDIVSGRRLRHGVPGELLRAGESSRRRQAERRVERDDGRAGGRGRPGRGKNGRANASARSTSAATRSISRAICLSRRVEVCSTGACRNSATAANFTRGSGFRFSRCRTTGMAAASAPTRKRGERKDGIIRNHKATENTKDTFGSLWSLWFISSRSRRQVLHQRELQRLLRVQQLVVDARAAQLAAVAVDEPADGLQVVLADDARHGHHLFVGLEILEPRRPLEREVDFVGIEDVKHQDIRAAMVKELQPAHHRLGIVQQIGDEHDHPAFGQRLGELTERFRHVGRPAGAAAARARRAGSAGGPGACSPAAR